MKIPITYYANINQLETKPDILHSLQQATATSSIDHSEDVNITRTDWHLSKNTSRPWVQRFMPHLQQHLYKTIHPFHDFIVQDIWFQQYDHHSQHGWHTHSHNFTGVYYVTHPTSQTEIIDPISQNIISLPVKQNDVVVFPSTTIHRSPPASNKVIISFNFDAFYHYNKPML